MSYNPKILHPACFVLNFLANFGDIKKGFIIYEFFCWFLCVEKLKLTLVVCFLCIIYIHKYLRNDVVASMVTPS